MVQKLNTVDAALRREIDSLIQASAAADGFEAEFYTDVSINAYKGMASAYCCRQNGSLAGFLIVFAPSQEIIEISAQVHPDYRKQGCFRALLKEALQTSAGFGYHKGYFVCNEASVSALEIMSHWQYALITSNTSCVIP